METFSKSKAVIIGLLVVLAIVVGWLAFSEEAETKEYVSLEECFLYQPNIVYVPIRILGIEVDETLYEIIKCENRAFDPTICNEEYGCGAGIGLAMIIPSTGRHCEEKLGRELDLFDPRDNLDCAKWLLENEGTQHWGTPDSDWGTYYCWSV